MEQSFWAKCKNFWIKAWSAIKRFTWNIWQKIKKPKAGILALVYALTVLVCGFSIAVAILTTLDRCKPWLAIIGYVSYGVATVLLTYAVYTLVTVLPKQFRAVKGKLRSHKYIGKLMENYELRTVIFAVFSVAVTLAFVAYHAVASWLYHSVWFGALATYYIILLIIRGGIVLYHGKHRKREREKERGIRKYRACGIGLMITISALSATIWEMVQNGAATRRAGLMIYVVATYTCYKIAMSIVHFIKAKKQDDYTVDALRNVNLADAAVALLAMQASMLQEFSETGLPIFNILTGAGVCLFVFGLGLYMVIRSQRFKREVQEEFTGDKGDKSDGY